MRHVIQAVREERRLIVVAALIFILSGVFGYVNAEEVGRELEQAGVWEQLKDAARIIKEDPSFWTGFQVIFFHNMLSAMVMIGLGIFFGLFPVISLITNGIMIGMVLQQASLSTGQSPLSIFVTTILPHGVLEIPAIILAAVYGIRLGITLLGSLVSLFVPSKRRENLQEWKRLIRRFPAAVITIGILLLLAAVIETGLILR